MTEVERDAWKAAAVIIDPTSHPDGQKAAVEGKVGNPTSIFKSLSRHINDSNHEPYIIEANQIVDPETFWEFEIANRGQITSISFDLFAPNMFGLRNELDKELKELRDNEKVREARLTLENPDGLDVKTDRVQQTVAYTLEGGGNIRAKTKTKKRYNSKNKTIQITVETGEKTSFIETVTNAIARLFP